MSSSHKKVIVRRFQGDLLPGYLSVSGFLRRHDTQPGNSDEARPSLQLLDLEGRMLPVPLGDVKTVSYVRDFNLCDTLNPARLLRRTFLARPRTEGLWVRVTFRSGDLLEGLAPLDMALADDLLEDAGVHLSPPDTRSNTQRIFVPRTAMSALQLLAVITAPSRRRSADPTAPQTNLQEKLFASSSS